MCVRLVDNKYEKLFTGILYGILYLQYFLSNDGVEPIFIISNKLSISNNASLLLRFLTSPKLAYFQTRVCDLKNKMNQQVEHVLTLPYLDI